VRRGRLPALIASGALVVIALAVAYPGPMVSPGALVRGHAEIEGKCFACHAPWRGAASTRCIRCHRLPDIGLRTTRGVAVAQRTPKVSFHQELIEQDCMACHSDHEGLTTRRSRKPFSHELLRPAARQSCGGCHAAPSDKVHRDLAVSCSRCHRPDRWKPAPFDHAMLTQAEQEHCESCHRPPTDDLHRPVKSDCQQCHSQKRWKPPTFDHAKRFVLDSDHNVSCATCHSGNDYQRASCYGCHAHQPEPMRVKHLEEGIRNLQRCARCHRDPGAEPEGGDT
jgi:Class III cytochrome C family